MDLGHAFKGVINSREKPRSTPIARRLAASPITPPGPAGTEAQARLSNYEKLERIGGYLLARGARDICIGELEEGYMVCYLGANTQAVETLTFAEVAALPAAAEPSSPDSLPRQLAAIGRYLDRNLALSLFIDQRQEGYYVEYAAPPGGAYTAAHLARVSRFLDEDTMRNLMLPTSMLPGGQV